MHNQSRKEKSHLSLEFNQLCVLWENWECNLYTSAAVKKNPQNERFPVQKALLLIVKWKLVGANKECVHVLKANYKREEGL